MSRNVSNETPSRSGIMCSSRLKINLPIATTFGIVAKPVAACQQKGNFPRPEGSVNLSRMKRFETFVLMFAAAIFCFAGCGKKTETAPEKSAANYPLPEPPLVASCDPGVPGGRLVIGELGDPKTFDPITANETSRCGKTCAGVTASRSPRTTWCSPGTMSSTTRTSTTSPGTASSLTGKNSR